ncbi:dihydroorotase [Planobacterium oryzisoli]|uniref:Dihydroorotase n=1 Tax=Planobacterium oryzisoli TaxID=2771435 RepID=A0A930YVM3_9FLAO|nr:dihydroorotase [Planobacterium oryzisoli]MBF5027175.1 dihydroorotase [Planobacterium oryzisoli]
MKTLIHGALLVNEGKKERKDLLIENDRIVKIAADLTKESYDVLIDGAGKVLLPGVIDDQVHFREPGLTHKGDIESESRAAVAGGITTFIDQPNTQPTATTLERLEEKFTRASEVSYANYSFMMGGTNDNLQELLKTSPKKVAGIKFFLGSSTGNMLVDDPRVIEELFTKVKLLIAVHCEDESTIRQNTKDMVEKYGDDIPMEMHPVIRSEEACYKSSSKAVELAKKTGARLHVFHLSTEKETQLFDNTLPLKEKKITAEVCVHHLWFSDKDYASKGSKIKWNPAVKKESDREGLWKALLDGRIDVVATDHAPHTLEEKSQSYLKAPSGGPLVQHSLCMMLEKHLEGKISLELLVEKMCHNPAVLFEIKDRGFLREGYKADLVLVDLDSPWQVEKENILYKCGWSPLEGTFLKSKVTHTFVNGQLVYKEGELLGEAQGERLEFNR